jgi:hypothetical protein
MTFGELMSHIGTTNYQFCAGLKDAQPPALPSSLSKETPSNSSAIHLNIVPLSSAISANKN